uniref:C3H1-type domain-containing protein n=1 Tax=Oryza punctata TaxID=4537 RepID=A0A0E0LH03_ORYPU
MAGSEDGYHTADDHLEGEQRYDDGRHLIPSSGQEEEGSGGRNVVVPSSGQEGKGSGGRNVVVPGGHVAAEDLSGVGVPVGRDAGGAVAVHVIPSILFGTIHAPAPLSSSIFQGGLVGLKFGLGSGSMVGTGATGFGALPTSSTAEDSADHAAADHLTKEEEEQRYDDDGHLVPRSGQQEEGSGGHDVEEDHPDDLVPDLDLDLLVDGVVGPVPGGHLNADAAAFVPTTGGLQDIYSAISSSAAAYSNYITSSALAAAGHVSPFLDLPYARAFDSPPPLELVGPSSAPPRSATSHAGLVPYPSPVSPTSDSERTRDWIMARAAAALSPAPSRYRYSQTPASTVTGPFGFMPISGAPYAPPPSFAPIAGAGPAAGPPQPLSFRLGDDKTKLCRFYSHGRVCPRGRGNTCNYAHGEDDLRMVMPVSSLADAGEASSSSDSSSTAAGQGDKYKKKICKTFKSGRVCQFAANCRFAHGEVELGMKRPCWYFFSGQPCPRGDTCRFRHSY